MNVSRVLFIGAHPDDVELGCGGTISKFYDLNFEMSVLILAEGTSSRFNEQNTNSTHIESEIQNRKKDCLQSLGVLGIKNVHFSNLPCSNLNIVPLLKVNKIIENQIKLFKPEIIFTHSPTDTNKDHKVVFESTKIATRPSAFLSVKSVFSYEVPSSTECSFSTVFKPNYFISLEKKHLRKKQEALKHYRTEMRNFPHPRSLDGIEVLAKFRGMQVSRNYAESFETLRSIL